MAEVDQPIVQLSPKTIDRILHRVAGSEFDAQKSIEPELFEHTLQALNRAVDLGFGKVEYGDRDFDFVNSLKYNNAVFSAFKTHSEQNALRTLIFDDKGAVRSFADFRRASLPVIGQYNVNWLQTEYSTAVLRAQNTAKALAMQTRNHLQPNREWLPSTSPAPRAEHVSFYGLVLPNDDPFWASNYPGNLWNCKCGVRATSREATDNSKVKAAIKAAPKAEAGLDENPIHSRAIFSNSHPYIASCAGGAKTRKIVALECQKMMSERSRKEVRAHFKDIFGGKERIYAINNGAIKTLRIGYQDIKSITGKPHKFNYQRNLACYFLPEIFKKAVYVGCSPDVKFGKPGHNTSVRWHYYSFELNREVSYLTIQEHGNGSFRIHSIQDSDHFKTSKIKEKPSARA